MAPELAAPSCTRPPGSTSARGTPAEIAISILAELVARRHADPAPADPARGGGRCAGAPPSAVEVAADPVCGMKVAVTASTPRLEVGGSVVYFCCDHCRQAYAAQHAEAHAVG